MDNFVIEQLTKLGLESYIPVFRENEIGQEAYQRLEMEDLRVLLPGKIGPQRQIYTSIGEVSLPGSSRADNDSFKNAKTTATSDWVTAASTFQDSQPAFSFEDFDGGGVILYIDNSNIFINSQKHAARLHKFQHGIRFDKRCRIDVGKLVARAARGRDILVANLYGSEPPALDTVWKSIREKSVKVMTHKKSPWTNREKQIDTTLVADAVEGITQLRERAGDSRAVILFTGDKDMLTVIEKARSYHWRVEIWSYKAALSNEIEKEGKKSAGAIKIFYMDDYFSECTFSLTIWKKYFIPPERSMVMLFDENYIQEMKEEDKNKLTFDIVKKSTEILRVPTLVQFLTHKYEIKAPGKPGVPTTNRFMPLSPSKGHPQAYIPLALVSIQSQGSRPSNAEEKSQRPAYDFTKDIWSKKAQILKANSACFDIITYQQYRQDVQIYSQCPDMIDDDDDDELLDDLDDPDSLALDYHVVAKNFKAANQQYSDFCSYKFRCRHGLKCKFAHRDHEKEFFKEQPFAKRHLYKTKLCTHALTKTCKYEHRRHLCSYAHDFYECMCIICGEIGIHWADECPKKNHLTLTN